MPPRIRTVLRFNETKNVNNVGIIFANLRFTPTNAFDIDPVLGSTAAPGFTELSLLYRFYRVIRYKCKTEFSNKETFPVLGYICPVNYDPGANTSFYQNYLSSRSVKKKYMGAISGDSTMSLTQNVDITQFAGIANLQVADTFSSLVTGGPANNIFQNVGIVSAVSNLVSGVDISVDFDIEIEFYELANPPT
jgi:hypothetical protein